MVSEGTGSVIIASGESLQTGGDVTLAARGAANVFASAGHSGCLSCLGGQLQVLTASAWASSGVVSVSSTQAAVSGDVDISTYPATASGSGAIALSS